MGIGTGNKTTIAFTTSAITGKFTMIGAVKKKLGSEDVSDLQSDEFVEKEMHDLAEMEDTPFEMLLDNESEIPGLGLKELITITHPTRAGQATPATHAAWGALSEISLPEAVNNTTMRLTGAITWTNRNASGAAVKPLWTPATPTP